MRAFQQGIVLFVLFASAAGFCEEELSSDPRPLESEAELRFWLENMVWHHRFSDEEVELATGLSRNEISAAKERLDIFPDNIPEDIRGVRMLPYPGGRHPRIGFLEGAIRPQRETKVSVFLPWGRESGYVVVDVPEAIRSNLGIVYLAHTHVETVWTKTGVELPPMEWNRERDKVLALDRTLPNNIRYRAEVMLVDDHLEMELKLTNGTEEKLTGLRVQNCIMLKAAPGFEGLTNNNKVLEAPFGAVHSVAHPDRWIITAWEPCWRPWGNARVPCLHSDPVFPDCEPGQTQVVRGWLSFYKGDNVREEFERIRKAFFSSTSLEYR